MAYHLAMPDARREDRRKDGPDVRVPHGFETVIGESAAIDRSLELARKVALRGAKSILLTGETGTGKELFARGIHYAGPDPEAPFVAVNCPTIPRALLESELFGHERGAFTGASRQKRGLLEVAGSGTLFLDEVSELPPDLQPKLLRALEERKVRRVGGTSEVEVHCRVLAATNRPLESMVAEGAFREDLYYRLNVIRIDLPPLRAREGDVEVLARHFLQALSRDEGLPVREPTPEAVEALRRHGWPGNVRELKNVIERAALLAEGRRIGPEHIVIQERESTPVERSGRRPEGDAIRIPPGGCSMEEIEAEALRITLRITGGNKSAAARILGCSRPTVIRKVELYGLGPSDWEGDS